MVADIIPHFDINDNDVDYFTRKVESCFMERNARPFIPILLGYGFKKSAWNLLKSKNILAATVNNFFGEEIEKLLLNIATLLELKTIKGTDNLENINAILKEVSKIEGPTNNFRGCFFETIVGIIAIYDYSGEMKLNVKIRQDNERAEMDVLVRTSSKLVIYECKGKKPEQLINKDDVVKWEEKAAFIYKYYKSNPENTRHNIIFNFWTTSDFTDEANAEFARIKVKKYEMCKKNGREILEFAKNLNLEVICGMLKQYFIR